MKFPKIKTEWILWIVIAGMIFLCVVYGLSRCGDSEVVPSAEPAVTQPAPDAEPATPAEENSDAGTTTE